MSEFIAGILIGIVIAGMMSVVVRIIEAIIDWRLLTAKRNFDLTWEEKVRLHKIEHGIRSNPDPPEGFVKPDPPPPPPPEDE